MTIQALAKLGVYLCDTYEGLIYERASLIVTSHKSFADWAEIFND